LKIALFTEWFFPVRGGVSSHVYGLAKELARRKHDVKVFTKRRSRRASAETAEYRGIAVRTLSPSIPINFPVIPPSGGQMREVFSKGDFDIVHSHHAFTPTPLLALWQAHSAGIPSVLTNHSIPARGYDGVIGDILSSALYPIRQYLNMADHIVAVSRAAADFMSLLVDYVPISVIANGVDCELFKPLPSIDRTGKRILYVSRLVNRKGPHVLIRAFKKVLASVPDAELVIVGEGYLKPVLEMMTYDLGLSESVRFLGDVGSEMLTQTYSSSDVFVLPSLHAESFGMVLLEAMASEVPVIASRTGGVPEVVSDGKEGILVKPGDETELSEALMRLLTNENERSEMGRAGRKKALRDYDWKVIGGKIEELYRSLA
jgi:glycosyltransferase involved in cell wall biosynthesis